MSLIKINNDGLKILEKLLKQGYAVGDGKKTKHIVLEMKRAQIPIHHGYEQETKKVIVALKQPFMFNPQRRTLNKTFFELFPKKT